MPAKSRRSTALFLCKKAENRKRKEEWLLNERQKSDASKECPRKNEREESELARKIE